MDNGLNICVRVVRVVRVGRVVGGSEAYFEDQPPHVHRPRGSSGTALEACIDMAVTLATPVAAMSLTRDSNLF